MAKKILNEQENINQPTEMIEEQNPNVELTKMEELENKEEANANFEAESESVNTDETVEKRKQLKLGVLKIRLDDSLPEDDEFETMWNELISVYRGRKTLPVTLTGIERTQTQGYVVVTYYKTQRILVPLTEMMIYLDEERDDGYTDTERMLRACNSMLGSEIDVIIKGMDKENESIVASRKDAMNRKRERFYLTPLSDGLPQVRVGRIVEARIVTTTQALARVEIFGVETILTADYQESGFDIRDIAGLHRPDTLLHRRQVLLPVRLYGFQYPTARIHHHRFCRFAGAGNPPATVSADGIGTYPVQHLAVPPSAQFSACSLPLAGCFVHGTGYGTGMRCIPHRELSDQREFPTANDSPEQPACTRP